MKLLRKILIVMALLAGCWLACQPNFIPEQERFKTVGKANIRSGPSTNDKVIATVNKGTLLTVLETKNDWSRVKLPNGKVGWIFRGLIARIDYQEVLIIRDTFVRLGPGTTYEAFTMAKKGEKLLQIGQQENWYQVKLPDGKIGWVSKINVSETERRNLVTIKEAHIRYEPKASSEVMVTVLEGTELLQLGRDGEWYKVRLPGGDTGWINKSEVNVVKDRNLVVVQQKAQVRWGPGEGYQIFATIRKGAQLTKLDERDNWYKVKLPNGKEGWIKKKSVTPSSQRPETVITNSNANIRVRPGTDYRILVTVKKNTKLTKLSTKGDWYRVRLSNGKIGWIHKSLVGLSSSSASGPKLVTNAKSNIRRGPSTDYIILTTVPSRTQLTKIGEQGDWYKVRLANGKQGWINKKLVTPGSKVLVTIKKSNIRRGPSTDYIKVTTVPANTPLTKIDKNGNWYKVRLSDGRTGWILNSLVKAQPYLLTTAKRSHIRKRPGTDFIIITTVEKGTQLVQIGKQKDWYHVRLPDGRTGWIHKSLVNSSGYPMGQESQNIQNIKVTTNDRSRVRKGPGKNYGVITVLNIGTELTQIGEQNGWARVRLANGRTGWIFKELITPITFPQIILIDNANIRSAPSTNRRIIDVQKKGTILRPIDEQEDWYKVRLSNGKEGWVHKDLVEDLKYADIIVTKKANIRSGPNTSYPKIDVIEEGTELTPVDVRGDWYQVELPRGKTGWIFKDLVSTINYPPVMTVKRTNVRSGPGTNYALVATVDEETEFRPFEERNQWYRIKLFDGETGWVSKSLVTPMQIGKVVTTQRAHVRTGPDINYKIITTLGAGKELVAVDETRRWFQVKLPDGQLGWISKDLANEVSYPKMITIKRASIRYGPDTDYDVMEVVEEGTEFTPIADQGNWYKVELSDKRTGWVYKGLVTEKKYGRIMD